jgi:hypothetical protein
MFGVAVAAKYSVFIAINELTIMCAPMGIVLYISLTRFWCPFLFQWMDMKFVIGPEKGFVQVFIHV